MRSFLAASAALLAACVSAAGVQTAAQQGCLYPSIASKLENCNTMSAFCSSVLGRNPLTTTISVNTYTTTMPATTLTYSIVKTTVNKTVTVTSSTLSSTTTVNVCASTTPAAMVGAGRPVPATAEAAGGSCGVGRYSSAYISAACQCDYDSTTYIASTTKTVSGGTTIFTTSAKPTQTVTVTTYLTTSISTTTISHTNCAPPANSTCMNPIHCSNGYSTGYYTFICGNTNYYDCSCGLDPSNTQACFSSLNVRCPQYYPPGQGSTACTQNVDCPGNQFCLTQYCDCQNPSAGVCVDPDVCLGDTVVISIPPYY